MVGTALYCCKHDTLCHMTDYIEPQLCTDFVEMFFHFSALKLTHACIDLVAMQVCYRASDFWWHPL